MQEHSDQRDLCCGYGMHGHRHWRHVIIKILVALFIFWAGVQFGELKALVHGSGYFNATYGYGPGMMVGTWR